MTKPTQTPPTAAQSLSAFPKSARDIMRKDRCLNRGFDRLPTLAFRSSRREEAHLESSEVRRRKLIRASLPQLLRIQETLTNAHDFVNRCGKILPMKRPSKQSLTQMAVKAMTDAVAKVVEDHRRRGRPLAVWRNGRASWISAGEADVSQDTSALTQTK